MVYFHASYLCVSAEISAVLKVDNRIEGHTHWRQLGKEAWGQSFSIELERVSDSNKQHYSLLSHNCSYCTAFRANTDIKSVVWY